MYQNGIFQTALTVFNVLAPGGDERRELRRPIVGQTGPSADDLAHGMAKMEPYREGTNNRHHG